MDIGFIYKSRRNNLEPDALNRRDELITPHLLMLVQEDVDEMEKYFLYDVQTV